MFDQIRNFRYDKDHKSIHSFLKTASRCSNCNEFGHISSQCFKTLKKCIYCCDSSHSFPKCHENLCHLCNLPGHSLKSCRNPHRCILCSIAGHDESICISALRPSDPDDCSEATCLNCRSKGHANCGSHEANLHLYSKTCSGCGLTGHPFNDCPKKSKTLKVDLFKKHVKEALSKIPEFSRKLNKRERRYWEKVKNKAFKKSLKKRKMKKRMKSCK